MSLNLGGKKTVGYLRYFKSDFKLALVPFVTALFREIVNKWEFGVYKIINLNWK